MTTTTSVQAAKRHIDVASTVNEYLQRADWRVHANANQGYSLGGLILNVSGKLIANYWLDEIYPTPWGKLIGKVICIFTIWICCAAIAPAGRCALCC
ncbi:hypothetical protein HORIV_37780 [Vreelandella olivaria]|uniref:Beta-lactamase-related domain-containing protein n=1 Tax=Vreelandella olivaria TaxID=390919 RepID=A0ABN5WWZ6_9GAMM|nr:hypothetical protein HORIV_37780 [Halomonas olivaria]